jgi:hypothetical protein
MILSRAQSALAGILHQTGRRPGVAVDDDHRALRRLHLVSAIMLEIKSRALGEMEER